MHKTLEVLDLRKDFVNRTAITQKIRSINKCDYIKLKSFVQQTKQVVEWREQSEELEKNVASYSFDRRLISGLYKNGKKIDQLKYNTHSKKKKCSTSLFIREMQV